MRPPVDERVEAARVRLTLAGRVLNTHVDGSRRPKSASPILRSARLLSALGSSSTAAPRLGAARVAEVSDAKLNASLSASYPGGSFPKGHSRAPRRPSSATGRARLYHAVSPEWTFAGGGPRACLAPPPPPRSEPWLGHEAASAGLAASLPGPPHGVSFARGLEPGATFAQHFARGTFKPPDFAFHRAAARASPGPAAYNEPVGFIPMLPKAKSSVLPRRLDSEGWLLSGYSKRERSSYPPPSSRQCNRLPTGAAAASRCGLAAANCAHATPGARTPFHPHLPQPPPPRALMAPWRAVALQ